MKRQLKLQPPPPTQAGFTIIESLLAVILVSILLAAVAPVIALSVATRLQSRRVEMATQAARTYIDGVRAGIILPPNSIRPLNEVTTDPATGNETFSPQRELFAQVEAPKPQTLPQNCPRFNDPYCVDPVRPRAFGGAVSLYCADMDGDGKCTAASATDLIVQAYRSTPAAPGTPNQPADPNDDGSGGFLLGVRVYRASSFDGNIQLQKMSDLGVQKASTYAGGGGDRTSPLVEMTTEIEGRSAKNYDAFCNRLGGCSSVD